MHSASRVVLRFAIAMVAGVNGHSSGATRQVHVALPLRDLAGKALEPSLLQDVEVLTHGIAERIISGTVMDGDQQGEDDLLMHNNITVKSAFCFTIANGANSAENDGDEVLAQGVNAVLADNSTLLVSSISGLAPGHWCCQGHSPAQNQIAQTKCYKADKSMLERDGLEESEKGLLRAPVGADGSIMMASAQRHENTRLMRSEKKRNMDMTPEGASAEQDPSLYPSQILTASLRDGLGNDALDLAAKQLAHLARATSGLILVDGQLLGKLARELGHHPARSRVMLQGIPVPTVAFYSGCPPLALGASPLP